MSKILVFRFDSLNGPGYFGRYLDRHEITYEVVKIDRNDPVPHSIDGVSGLVFMGGIMSVNDDLPWIPRILDLIRKGHERSMPMLGHCLGGQLISKALGGTVTRNPVEEIGWFPLEVMNNGDLPAWCSRLPADLRVFHWHNETFSVPENATHLFQSKACATQAFQIGNALALQFHLEITPYMVRDWSSGFNDSRRVTETNIQSPRTMIENLEEKVRRSEAVAEHIYGNWCRPLTNAHRD